MFDLAFGCRTGSGWLWLQQKWPRVIHVSIESGDEVVFTYSALPSFPALPGLFCLWSLWCLSSTLHHQPLGSKDRMEQGSGDWMGPCLAIGPGCLGGAITLTHQSLNARCVTLIRGVVFPPPGIEKAGNCCDSWVPILLILSDLLKCFELRETLQRRLCQKHPNDKALRAFNWAASQKPRWWNYMRDLLWSCACVSQTMHSGRLRKLLRKGVLDKPTRKRCGSTTSTEYRFGHGSLHKLNSWARKPCVRLCVSKTGLQCTRVYDTTQFLFLITFWWLGCERANILLCHKMA